MSDDRTGGARRPNLPLTDEVIHDHLTGRRIVGVYTLLTDETCRFLAVDFDKSGWRMHEKRLRGYRAIGYTVDQSHAASPPA